MAARRAASRRDRSEAQALDNPGHDDQPNGHRPAHRAGPTTPKAAHLNLFGAGVRYSSNDPRVGSAPGRP